MDFFDNALNKTREAFEITKKKTAEIYNVQKLKYNILTLENNRNKDLQRLGFIYYKQLKNAEIEDETVANLVDSVASKNAEIKAIKEEINSLKNNGSCENCGAEIDENSIFCSICGEKIKENGDDVEQY